MNPESRMRYRKTIAELDLFLTGHHLQLADISYVMMTDWAVELFCRGLSMSTVCKHLNLLNSMIKKASKEKIIGFNNVSRALSKSLAEMSLPLPVLMNERVFDDCIDILRSALKECKCNKHNVYIDMVLFSMLNGALPFEKIISLKKEDTQRFEGAGRIIIERNLHVRRVYVFNIKQSYFTPKQLKTAVTSEVFSVFEKFVNASGFDADEFVRSMWVACAIKSGLTASEALGYVGGTASYILPDFGIPVYEHYGGKSLWINTVNSMFFNETPRWYAMHMRKGVVFDDLRKEIIDNIRPIPEFFYPCRTIMKLRNGKKTIEEQPFIAQTVFFKSYPENVLPMFNVIGDKAWCYRILNIPGAPYAVIPQCDMERFQRAIGMFTPDMEIRPLGELSPKQGEPVIVYMAGLGSRSGEVEEIINKDGGSVIFRVKLATDKGYEFRIEADDRQIERIAGA